MPADDYSPDGSMTFAEFQAQVLSDPEVFRHWLAAHDAELRESVAKEIEAASVWELEDGDGLCGVCADAARIARGKE